jgi:hypothetical protein
VPVGTGDEVSVEQEDVIHETQRELLDIGFGPFSDDEFRPCLQNIFDACNVVECALKLNHA